MITDDIRMLFAGPPLRPPSLFLFDYLAFLKAYPQPYPRGKKT